jgi:hypothetical protein
MKSGCIVLILIFNIVIGTLAFGYTIETIFGKRPPVAISVVGGVIAGEVVVPTAVVLWMLKGTGIIHPPIVSSEVKGKS